jgi:hypothetical protein
MVEKERNNTRTEKIQNIEDTSLWASFLSSPYLLNVKAEYTEVTGVNRTELLMCWMRLLMCWIGLLMCRMGLLMCRIGLLMCRMGLLMCRCVLCVIVAL